MQFWTAEIEKQVAERVQLVLTDPTLLKIYAKFGGAVFRRSSVFHGLRRALADWGVKGRRCVEIGTFNGVTAAVLSPFFDEVVTIDTLPSDLKRQLLKAVGADNVYCVDVKDNEEKASLVESLTFDFAYLDGDHANDTETDWALVKGGGRVLFHEVWPFQEPVWKLVHQLPMEQVKFNGCGLALWEKGK